MRVIRALGADERGISSLLVAVSMVGLVGSASIAVDLGHLWSTRRHVITASDASSLAAASDYAVGVDGCSEGAPDYVADNAPATLVSCQPAGTPNLAGYVTVRAETPVDYAFAHVIGFSDRTVGSTTTAAWGIPAGVNGLRPFGLCKDEPSFRAWAANPRGVSPVARIPYSNEPGNCGAAPGNWGILDLDNVTPLANSDVKEWIVRGYPGRVRPGNMGGDTGVLSNSLDGDLSAVRGKRFPIPVFDRVVGQGQNARFHVIGFVNVELVTWQSTGAEKTRYLDVKFVQMVTAGECCDNGGPDFGARVVHICGVDPEFDARQCLT